MAVAPEDNVGLRCHKSMATVLISHLIGPDCGARHESSIATATVNKERQW